MSTWRKSSRSSGQGQCVEARRQAGVFQVRDSKLGDSSPILDMTAGEFAGLLEAIK